MRPTVTAFCIYALLCVPPRASGQDAQPSQLPLTYEGREGVWFARETAQKILVDLQHLREQLRLHELQAQKYRELGAIDDELVVRSTAQAQAALASLKLSEAQLASCEEAQRSWWRHPATWFGIGLLTTGMFVGAGYALAH